MPICNGKGDNGDHCCYINGQVCEFLFTGFSVEGYIPRCMVWDEMDTEKWRNSPVGRWMTERYPGYTCRDWPQNIPEIMATARNLCCWGKN